MKPVTRRSLHDPRVNLALGAYYLARQLELRGGSVEETLAAYNAGPTRIPLWKQWGEFREPAEFVETIPLAQTRDYVQIILRNLELYRWLYGGAAAADGPSGSVKEAEPPEAKPPRRPAPAAKPGAKKPAAARQKSVVQKGSASNAGKR
jgi:Soluble lytic murein transglycosylase and related regulatory proteins (some contain LysM/invasin domains)